MAEGIKLTVELDDKGKPKITQLSGELANMGKATKKAGDTWQTNFKKMGDAVAGLGRKLRSSLTGLPAMLGYAGLGASFGILIKQGMSFNATLEKTETSFGVIYNDTVRARNAMKELVDFAAKTPFQLVELSDAAKTLESFGVGGKRYLTLVGDAAAAAQRPLSEIVMTLGRIKSGKSGIGEAFNRLAEMGIATRDMLKGEGLKFDKGGSYIGSVDDALAAVTRIIERRFTGMMDKLSQTWVGKWSTLKDNFAAFAGELTRPLFERLKPRLDEMTGIFQEMAKSPLIHYIGNKMADAADKVAGKILDWVSNFENVAKWVLIIMESIGFLYDGFKDFLSWFKEAWKAGMAWAKLEVLSFLGVFDTLSAGPVQEWGIRLFQGMFNVADMKDYARQAFGEALSAGVLGDDANKHLEEIRKLFEGEQLIGPSLTPGPTGLGLDADPAEKARAEALARQEAAHEAYLNRKLELEKEYLDDVTEMYTAFQMNMVDNITRGYMDGFATTILDTHTSLKDNLEETWQGIKEAFVRGTLDMVAAWIASKVKMLLIERAARSAGAAAEVAQAGVVAGAESGVTGAAAGAAAAKYHSAYAGIPFFGPQLAAAAITAMHMQIAMAKALGSVPGMREGGVVGGIGSGSEDDKLYRLATGEAILNRAAVSRVGAGAIDNLNAGKMPGGGPMMVNEWNVNASGRMLRQEIEDEVVPILERLIRQGRFKIA